jgi:hypothetical protein
MTWKQIHEKALAASAEYRRTESALRKARRAAARVAVQVGPARVVARRNGNRVPLPALIRHAVHLRDEGRCAYIDPARGRCRNKRWLELHHPRRVALGGLHSEDNLVTLCTFHHHVAHGRSVFNRKVVT